MFRVFLYLIIIIFNHFSVLKTCKFCFIKNSTFYTMDYSLEQQGEIYNDLYKF